MAIGIATLLTGVVYVIASDMRGGSADKSLTLALYCGGGAIAAIGLGVQLWREEFRPKRPD